MVLIHLATGRKSTRARLTRLLRAETCMMLGIGAILLLRFMVVDEIDAIASLRHSEVLMAVQGGETIRNDGAADPVMTMATWGKDIQEACRSGLAETAILHNETARRRKREIETAAIQKMRIPSDEMLKDSRLIDGRPKYKHCKNVFIDLGSNIGDSIAYFVETEFDLCTREWASKFGHERKFRHGLSRIKLDTAFPAFTANSTGSNRASGLFRKYMPVHEDACVYGMEGNPAFTERLKKLENLLMLMEPRPVQHVHIHTQTVIAGKDGLTELYLDEHSTENNFWGSSILSSQQDAVKTAERNGGRTVSTPVTAISLTTLLWSTLMPFKPNAIDGDETSGGTVIIKMDVEGAEYQVLKEVATSNMLCDYIKMGNTVVMVVEFHVNSISDEAQRRQQMDGTDAARDKLEGCGVIFAELGAG
eukprot:CAMPEP_0119562754 /NCGR_PEP_ID=MMETSP1352-20130426/21433_1 /TAXON_ID=265584 /ORGANISM="Stauroneis constricta, Strain CCMP1120" /LENGTH=419 /DNA_ID=CAMNT_0007611217 /DNA_START=58 /DNA_END=1314 /DNA_ORIENTATION=+